jgi:hypothetical protein
MLVVPMEGELQLLNKMLQAALAVDEDYVLMLYVNNYTPNANTTATSFTEANFTNYTAMTLQRANWNAATIVSGEAQTSYGANPQTWTCGVTGNTVVGYWVEGSVSGKVLWAEQFAVARTLAQGDVLNVTPTFQLASMD